MSSYAVIGDVRKRIRESELIGLTDENDLGVVDTTVVDDAIEAASVEIDGYLGGRYTLPLVTVPDIIKKLCVDIGIYNLYSLGDGPPDTREKRYKDAIAFLKAVSKGDISLGANDPEGTGPGDTAGVSSTDPVFSNDSLKNY